MVDSDAISLQHMTGWTPRKELGFGLPLAPSLTSVSSGHGDQPGNEPYCRLARQLIRQSSELADEFPGQSDALFLPRLANPDSLSFDSPVVCANSRCPE